MKERYLHTVKPPMFNNQEAFLASSAQNGNDIPLLTLPSGWNYGANYSGSGWGRFYYPYDENIHLYTLKY